MKRRHTIEAQEPKSSVDITRLLTEGPAAGLRPLPIHRTGRRIRPSVARLAKRLTGRKRMNSRLLDNSAETFQNRRQHLADVFFIINEQNFWLSVHRHIQFPEMGTLRLYDGARVIRPARRIKSKEWFSFVAELDSERTTALLVRHLRARPHLAQCADRTCPFR